MSEQQHDARDPGPARRVPGRVRPAHVAVAIVLAGGLWIAASPINDLDSYWHVLIGREIVARHTVDGLGLAWLGVPTGPWRTSQWLSEVGMYAAVDRFGWVALPVLRLITAAALFAVLALTLVRRRQPIAGFAVVLVAVSGLEILLQDRPATVSLVLVALLGPACERLWATGRRPPLLAVAGLCLLWAQLHGLWVLAPAAFVLVAVGGLLERRHAPPGQVRGALACAAASLTGTINPQGPVSFLLPLRFKNAAGARINEWIPTTFTYTLTIAWGILVLLLIVAWVRSPVRVPTTEIIWSLLWTVFALTAMRNVGPVILLTAPVVLRALERTFGSRLDRFSASPSPRVGRVLTAALTTVVVACAVAVGTSLAGLDPLRETPALAIARRLATAPGPLRVWNGYNVGGSLVAFAGGGDGHVRLVVDGRSDLWGAPYIEKLTSVQNLGSGWETEFARFAPDAVVLPPDTPINVYLMQVRHWRIAMRDEGYDLLVPPDSPLLEP